MDIGKFLVSLTLLWMFPLTALCQSRAEGDKILGVYEVVGEVTGEKARVEFYRESDSYQARMIWLENPSNPDGSPRLDADNPDPELRKRSAVGIVLIEGLRYDEKSESWSGGRIYNPVGGKTYDVNAKFEEAGILKIRGYIGKPMLGKTYYWKKLK